MQKYFLIGNLVKDPELRYTGDGLAYCRFTIAENDTKKDGSPMFFSIVAFGKLAEACGKYLEKGRRVHIVGEILKQEKKIEGENKTITYHKYRVKAREVKFL